MGARRVRFAFTPVHPSLHFLACGDFAGNCTCLFGPLQRDPHLDVESLILSPQTRFVAVHQARGVQGFDILMHPAIVAAEGQGQDADVFGAALMDVPQQFQPLG